MLLEGLERIEHSAFSFCTSLSRIDIPASVKNVGTAAVFECNNWWMSQLHQGC